MNRSSVLAILMALPAQVAPASEVVGYELVEGVLEHGKCGPDGGFFEIPLTGTFTVILRQGRTGVAGTLTDVDFHEVSGLKYCVTGTGGFFIRINPESPDGLPGISGMDFSLEVSGENIDGTQRRWLTTELTSSTTFPKLDFPLFTLDTPVDWCRDGLSLWIKTAVPAPNDAVRFFRRGNVNGDGRTNITDAIVVVEALFHGESGIPCLDAADANDDGRVDISDAVAVLQFLFLGTGDLPVPGRLCGIDPTADALGCGGQAACMSE